MKTKVILWSGGFDSTMILLQACENWTEGNPYEIQLMSVNIPNTGEAKNKRELKVRDEILKYVKERYPKVPIYYNITKVVLEDNLGINTNGNNNTGLAQPILWALSTVPLLPDGCELNFGYIKEDDAIPALSDIESLVNSAAAINQKNLTVNFPLKFVSKTDVLKFYIENALDLIDVCTSCENEDETDLCGRCKPCTHLMEALIRLLADSDSNIVKHASDILKSKFRFKIGYNTTTESYEFRGCDNLGFENTLNDNLLTKTNALLDYVHSSMMPGYNGAISDSYLMCSLADEINAIMGSLKCNQDELTDGDNEYRKNLLKDLSLVLASLLKIATYLGYSLGDLSDYVNSRFNAIGTSINTDSLSSVEKCEEDLDKSIGDIEVVLPPDSIINDNYIYRVKHEPYAIIDGEVFVNPAEGGATFPEIDCHSEAEAITEIKELADRIEADLKEHATNTELNCTTETDRGGYRNLIHFDSYKSCIKVYYIKINVDDEEDA